MILYSTIKITAVHDVYGSFNNTLCELLDQHEKSVEDNTKVGHISVEIWYPRFMLLQHHLLRISSYKVQSTASEVLYTI